MAARTRSRASFTAASGRPTISKARQTAGQVALRPYLVARDAGQTQRTHFAEHGITLFPCVYRYYITDENFRQDGAAEDRIGWKCLRKSKWNAQSSTAGFSRDTPWLRIFFRGKGKPV